MSQFTFSVRGSSQAIADHIAEFPSASTAAIEAARYAATALGTHPSAFLEDDEWMVDVTDETGLLLVSIAMSLTRSPAMRR